MTSVPNADSPALLDARLQAPALPVLTLKRREIADRLLKSLDAPGRVIGLFAPAGYAKTSLLRSVQAELDARGTAVGWLTLGAECNDTRQLGRYLLAALQRAGVAVDVSVAAGDALTAILNAVARREPPLVLLLDQAEALHSRDSLAWLDALLAAVPASLRVVLAARRNPGLRLGPLLAAQRLELREPAELAFSFAETTEFLSRVIDESPGAAALHGLHQRTQGWPGLLGVLVASVPHGSWLELPLREERLPQRAMWSYIEEEVIAGWPAADLQVLWALALTPQLDQALLAFIHDPQPCAVLEQWSLRNPLVQTLPAGAFALHPEIRACVRARLQADQPERFRQINGRLAEAARHRNDMAAAIDYLIDAAELTPASELLETEGRDIALGGFPDRVIDWLKHLHPETRNRPAGLQLAEVWARVTMHETAAAAALLQSARVHSAQRRSATFNIEVMTATAFSHAISDHRDAAMAAVQGVPESAQALSPIVRAGCATVQAWCLFSAGRFDEARQLLYRSASLERQGQGMLAHAYAAVVSGECYAAEGQMAAAEAVFRRAVKLAENLRGRRSMVVVITLGPLLDVLYEMDRIDEVLALASGRNHLRLKYSTPGSASAAGVALAHSLILRNAGSEAAELLDDILAVGEESHLPRIVAYGLAARIQLALRNGQWHEVAELAGRLDALRDDSAGLLDSPQGVINYLCRLSQIRILASRERLGEALSQTQQLVGQLAGLPWLRARIAVSTMLAELLWRSGDQDAAATQMAAIVQQASPLGLIRSIVDQLAGSELIESAALRRLVAAPLHAYLDRLKTAMASSLPGPQPGQRMIAPGSAWTDAALAGAHPGFTARERELLFLLARGLSTKRIAQSLRISPDTAKWHTRNIYEKLGVHDRAAARQAILQLQLAEGASAR